MGKDWTKLQIIWEITFEQERGEVAIGTSSKIMCSRCYKQGRAKLQIIWEFIFEQGRGEAVTGTSSKILCNRCYEQGRSEATNIFGSLYLSKDGAKPQQEYSPRQRLGYGCIN